MVWLCGLLVSQLVGWVVTNVVAWILGQLEISNASSKGEIRYMTVRQNRSDQLIGSNWIRRANPERPTVGRGLPAEGCPPWAGRGLRRKMSEFSLHEGVQLLGRSVLVFSLNFDWAY